MFLFLTLDIKSFQMGSGKNKSYRIVAHGAVETWGEMSPICFSKEEAFGEPHFRDGTKNPDSQHKTLKKKCIS